MLGGLLVAVSTCSIRWNHLSCCKGMISVTYRLVVGFDDILIDPLLENLGRYRVVLEQSLWSVMIEKSSLKAGYALSRCLVIFNSPILSPQA